MNSWGRGSSWAAAAETFCFFRLDAVGTEAAVRDVVSISWSREMPNRASTCFAARVSSCDPRRRKYSRFASEAMRFPALPTVHTKQQASEKT